jgi:hypothetical protein
VSQGRRVQPNTVVSERGSGFFCPTILEVVGEDLFTYKIFYFYNEMIERKVLPVKS